MKIAFVLTNYPSSGATFITNQMTGLIDLGHDVRIFALSPQQGLKKLHEDVVEYGLLNRLEYHGKPLNRIEELKVLFGDFLNSPKAFFKRINNSLNLEMFGKRSYTGLAYFLLRTFEKFRDIDVFNPHLGTTGINSLFLKDLYPNSRLIVHFHGGDLTLRVRQRGTHIFEKLFKTSDLITSQSFYSRDCLISIGCPPEKIIKHPVGVDLQKFKYKERILKPDEKKKLLIISRLVEKKGHIFLLNAFSEVLKKRQDVELHIVGDGELKKVIKNRIEDDELLRKNVFLHGFMTLNEVVKSLNESHIFIHPSVTSMRWADQEDTTTVLLEAQAMGLPVISTYHAGIPEVVINEKTGLLVPERDEKGLVEAINYYISNPELWNEIGKAGRKLMEDKFDIRKLNKKLEWIFLKVKEMKPGENIGIESTEEIEVDL